jgi:predicted Zn finger-like uncharacterized protein
MIVRCDRCRTQFRVADEKVPPAGAKVRCTRCGEHFLVLREAAPAPVQPAPQPSPHPGAAATAEVASAPGFTGARPRISSAPTAFPPSAPLGSAPAAWPHELGETPLDEGLSLVPRSDTSEPALARAALADPRRSSYEPVAPGGFDFEHLSSSPSEPASPRARSPSLPSPGAFDDLARPPPEGVSVAPRPAWPASEGALVHERFPVPSSAPAGGGFAPGAHPPQDRLGAHGGELPSFPPPPHLLRSGPHQDNLGDLPGLLAFADDDPFAGVDLGARTREPDIEVAPSRDALAVPFAPTPLPAGLGRPGLSRTPADDKAPRPPPGRSESHPRIVAPPSRVIEVRAPPPAAEPPPASAPRGPAAWPTWAGVALGVVLALALFPSVRARLEQVLRPGSSVAPTLSSPPLVAGGVADVRVAHPFVTTYPGARGRRLLVVGGQAINAGTVPRSGLTAVVLALDGERVAERRATPVGLALDPEALAAVDSPEALEAALGRLVAERREPADLAPGASAPFLAVFPEVSADAPRRTYRIEFVAGSAQP